MLSATPIAQCSHINTHTHTVYDITQHTITHYYTTTAATDISNGKSVTTSAPSLALGGQCGLQTRTTGFNGTTALVGGWMTSSATINVPLKAGRYPDIFIQNALVQGFTPYNGMSTRQGYMDSVAASTANTSQYGLLLGRVRIIAPYIIATRAWSKGTEQPSQSAPGILMSRGVVIEPQFTTNAIIIQVPAAAATTAAILLLLLLLLLLQSWLSERVWLPSSTYSSALSSAVM
jgi:hypothetical protein